MRGSLVSERLSAADGRPSGFDYLRIALSLAVLASHTVNVCYGSSVTVELWTSPFRPPLAIILPVFFSLSGFLVAGSLERSRTIISFAGLRVIRIVPALAVDTLLSALILGPIFTRLEVRDYFLSKSFWTYLLNVAGDIHYFLPGVFDNNVWGAAVNQQLWTLPYELICYVSISVIALAGLARSRWIFLGVTLTIFFPVFIRSLLGEHADRVTFDGPGLVVCFLSGVAAYLFRDQIRLTRLGFIMSLSFTFVIMQKAQFDLLTVAPATYIMLYIGTLKLKRISIICSGDYSYGIFLYGFPIQQSIVAALGEIGRRPEVNFTLAFILTGVLAFASWWLVERPALKLRPQLYSLESWMTKVAYSFPLGRHLVQPARGPRLKEPPAREPV